MGKKDDDLPSPVILAVEFLQKFQVIWYREDAYLRDGIVWRKLEKYELRSMIVRFIDEVLQ